MKSCLTILLSFFFLTAMAQQPDTAFLKNLLESHRDLLDHVLNHPTHYEVQILYTQIDRDQNNVPHFTSYSYRLNANHYFYPASTVKLPTAIFTLEKLNELKISGLSKQSIMKTDSDFAGQTKVSVDSTAKNGLPSIEN